MNPAQSPSRSDTRWGLQLKLILSMLLVGVVPLMVGLSLAFWQGSREIRVVNGESFKALAEETARKVDLLMSDEVARTSRIATDPSIIRELERRRDALTDMTEDDRRFAVGSREIFLNEAGRCASRDSLDCRGIFGLPTSLKPVHREATIVFRHVRQGIAPSLKFMDNRRVCRNP